MPAIPQDRPPIAIPRPVSCPWDFWILPIATTTQNDPGNTRCQWSDSKGIILWSCYVVPLRVRIIGALCRSLKWWWRWRSCTRLDKWLWWVRLNRFLWLLRCWRRGRHLTKRWRRWRSAPRILRIWISWIYAIVHCKATFVKPIYNFTFLDLQVMGIELKTRVFGQLLRLKSS